jgi:CheY-like chemotaxis protein
MMTEPKAEQGTAGRGSDESGAPFTILIAEDEPSIRALLRTILSRAGYAVLEAEDGQEAVRVFRENSAEIDLLLFDVRMPRMSGLAAYQQIAEHRPSIPAIFCSGYFDQMIGRGPILPAGTSLIEKPFEPEILIKKIADFVGRPTGA